MVGACDDGRVEKLGRGHTILLCLSWARGQGVLDLAFLPIRVDGLEATSIAKYLLASLRPRPEVVLLDSLTTGGFNIISPATVYEALGAPVVVVYTYKPSLDRVRSALEAGRLPYRRVRERVLALLGEARRIDTPRGPLYTITWPRGYDPLPVIEYSQVYDRKPAPLRAAHYISSALSRVLGGKR